MEFEWDAEKSTRNHATRGLPFELAKEVFHGPTLEQADDRHDYREVRIKAIGRAGNRILVCVYTDRVNVRRIISLRYANRRERDAYGSAIPG